MPYTYTVLGFMICEASIFATNNQMFLHVFITNLWWTLNIKKIRSGFLVEKGLIPKPNIQNYFI